MPAVMLDSVSRLDSAGRVVVQAEKIVTVENTDLETKYDCDKGGEMQKEALWTVYRMQEKKCLQSQSGYVGGFWILWITVSVQTWRGLSLSGIRLAGNGDLGLLD
jgi:hypothetical protein